MLALRADVSAQLLPPSEGSPFPWGQLAHQAVVDEQQLATSLWQLPFRWRDPGLRRRVAEDGGDRGSWPAPGAAHLYLRANSHCVNCKLVLGVSAMLSALGSFS